MEKFTLFWGGPFSQWLPCIFTIDNIEYNCTEQYMMAEKARFFKDDESLEKIMKSNNPRSQKAYGRKVKNFNAEAWSAHAKSVVFKANIAKFSQNKNLLTELFNTKGTTLVEASPYDKIWGIGLGADNPDALDRSKWHGTNWLGEVLNKVRDKLMIDFNENTEEK